MKTESLLQKIFLHYWEISCVQLPKWFIKNPAVLKFLTTTVRAKFEFQNLAGDVIRYVPGYECNVKVGREKVLFCASLHV